MSAFSLSAPTNPALYLPPAQPTVITPRPYQLEAEARILNELRAEKATLLVLATGLGKTVVFSMVARNFVARGQRVMILDHREELTDQNAEKAAAVCGVPVSIDMGDRHATNTPIVVASVQTMVRRKRRYHPDHFALIIVDEAHHAAATSYQTIFAHFPNAMRLGVTATDDRLDGASYVGPKGTFRNIAFRYDIRQGIRDGHLAPLRAKRVRLNVDLDKVKVVGGDLKQDELAVLLEQDDVILEVAHHLEQLVDDRPSIVFTASVNQAYALANQLNCQYRDRVAYAVDAETDARDRRAIVNAFRMGRFQFLLNCGLFTEGTDLPLIECVAIVRPTKSRSLYTQMVGRGTRPCEETGKTDCLLLDFAGMTKKHSLVCPLDVLAGTSMAHAAHLLDGEDVDLEEALEDAMAMPRQTQAVAGKGAIDVDPFDIGPYDRTVMEAMANFAIDLGEPTGREGPSPKQCETLERNGLVPDGLDRKQASKLIDCIVERNRQGLCTLKQSKLLRKYKIDDPWSVSRAAADKIIAALRANHFRPLRQGEVEKLIAATEEALPSRSTSLQFDNDPYTNRW